MVGYSRSFVHDSEDFYRRINMAITKSQLSKNINKVTQSLLSVAAFGVATSIVPQKNKSASYLAAIVVGGGIWVLRI